MTKDKNNLIENVVENVPSPAKKGYLKIRLQNDTQAFAQSHLK